MSTKEKELDTSVNDTTTLPAILIQGTHGADNAEKATLLATAAEVTFVAPCHGGGRVLATSDN